MSAKLKITLKKSVIGGTQPQRDTVRSLGLKKTNSTVVQDDTAVIRGMIHKVRHLVVVEPVDTAEAVVAE